MATFLEVIRNGLVNLVIRIAAQPLVHRIAGWLIRKSTRVLPLTERMRIFESTAASLEMDQDELTKNIRETHPLLDIDSIVRSFSCSPEIGSSVAWRSVYWDQLSFSAEVHPDGTYSGDYRCFGRCSKGSGADRFVIQIGTSKLVSIRDLGFEAYNPRTKQRLVDRCIRDDVRQRVFSITTPPFRRGDPVAFAFRFNWPGAVPVEDQENSDTIAPITYSFLGVRRLSYEILLPYKARDFHLIEFQLDNGVSSTTDTLRVRESSVGSKRRYTFDADPVTADGYLFRWSTPRPTPRARE